MTTEVVFGTLENLPPVKQGSKDEQTLITRLQSLLNDVDPSARVVGHSSDGQTTKAEIQIKAHCKARLSKQLDKSKWKLGKANPIEGKLMFHGYREKEEDFETARSMMTKDGRSIKDTLVATKKDAKKSSGSCTCRKEK